MVVQSLPQLEKNVSASFGYVKKDLLMLNDAVSDLNDKIRHLSLNHAALLEKLQKVSKNLSDRKEIKKVAKKNVKKELSFYDLTTKERFKTKKYAFRTKAGKKFAVATSPSGKSVWRIVGIARKIVPPSETAPKKIVTETIEY